MTSILLTNDDGYNSEGIIALYKALQDIGQVTIVAPDRDNSAVSHSLTMNRPLRVKEIQTDIFAIDGTPADCVAIATNVILKKKPDILVSGINRGPNIGDDISYSGTVSAAIEGTMYSIPSLAFSMIENKENLQKNAQSATQVVAMALEKGLPENTLLNINFPATTIDKGIKITRQGRRLWKDSITETVGPWGRALYWIGGGTPSHDTAVDTDGYAVSEGYISITPIHIDKTNHEGVFQLREEWSGVAE